MDTNRYHSCTQPHGTKEDQSYETGRYGDAVTLCYENELGELYLDNGEYNNQANYCPFCGFKAKVGI